MTTHCPCCGGELSRKATTPAPTALEYALCEPSPPGPTAPTPKPTPPPSESATLTLGGSYEPMEAILLQVLKILENSSALYDLSLSKDSEQLSFSFKADIPAVATERPAEPQPEPQPEPQSPNFASLWRT